MVYIRHIAPDGSTSDFQELDTAQEVLQKARLNACQFMCRKKSREKKQRSCITSVEYVDFERDVVSYDIYHNCLLNVMKGGDHRGRSKKSKIKM